MGGTPRDERVRRLLERHGRTFAAEAGIRLRDTPAPLFQLLVLAHLLSAPMRSGVAVASARALFEAGMRDARRMAEASWRQRVDALGRGGYQRYDERTATLLGRMAERVRDRYRGDLRRIRDEGRTGAATALREMPGIGPVGTDIFLREVQGVWPECAPYFDGRTREGARRLDLPVTGRSLSTLVDESDLSRLAAGLVRVALDSRTAREVRGAA